MFYSHKMSVKGVVCNWLLSLQGYRDCYKHQARLRRRNLNCQMLIRWFFYEVGVVFVDHMIFIFFCLYHFFGVVDCMSTVILHALSVKCNLYRIEGTLMSKPWWTGQYIFVDALGVLIIFLLKSGLNRDIKFVGHCIIHEPYMIFDMFW